MIHFLGASIEFPCEGCKHKQVCNGKEEFMLQHWRYSVECEDFEREYDGTLPKPTDLHFLHRKYD